MVCCLSALREFRSKPGLNLISSQFGISSINLSELLNLSLKLLAEKSTHYRFRIRNPINPPLIKAAQKYFFDAVARKTTMQIGVNQGLEAKLSSLMTNRSPMAP
jgi:hypothetical protein